MGHNPSPDHTPSPDVVVPAEHHATLAVAGAANLAQLGLAAGALEAACVPVSVHGEEQEAVSDAAPTACAGPGGGAAGHLAVHHGGPAGGAGEGHRH